MTCPAIQEIHYGIFIEQHTEKIFITDRFLKIIIGLSTISQASFAPFLDNILKIFYLHYIQPTMGQMCSTL